MAQIATERAEPVAAAVANPAPLGLSAFALTTFVLSWINAGLVSGTETTIVVGLAIFYGGIVQLVAGIHEFRAGNTFGATAFCSYGGFWLSFGAIFIPGFGVLSGILSAKGAVPADVDQAVGLYLLGWTIFTGLMLIGALRSNGALIAVFALLFITFLLLTIGKLGTSTGIYEFGGYVGILTALVAWYTALAGLLASSKSAFQLPVFPMR